MNGLTDEYFMARAIRLAEGGLYTTHPNPRVGSVMVANGEVIGEGFHLKAGAAHAEVHALEQAGERARGATVYCTLEPCSYHGRTPACAKALIDAGVRRVVCAMTDPHPRNSGAGFAMLEEAGIEVVRGVLETSARALNPGHAKRYEKGLPFVRAKVAMSLDGRTALANGVSEWVTSTESRKDVQKLRARSDAVVTGVQTVNDDNPRLTVREGSLDVRDAALAASLKRPIYILDANGRIDRGADLLDNPDAVLVTSGDHDVHGRASRLEMKTGRDGRIDLKAFLEELARREHNEVLFECGATLAGALVKSGLLDELVLYAAPVMLGHDARALLQLPKIDKMRDRIEWDFKDVRRIGADLRMTLTPATPE